MKARTRRQILAILFEAEPMVHPRVIGAYKRATGLLKKHRIRFRLVGELAANLTGAGRPTDEVELVVARRNLSRALTVVQRRTTKSPNDIRVTIWPEGVTAGEKAER